MGYRKALESEQTNKSSHIAPIFGPRVTTGIGRNLPLYIHNSSNQRPPKYCVCAYQNFVSIPYTAVIFFLACCPNSRIILYGTVQLLLRHRPIQPDSFSCCAAGLLLNIVLGWCEGSCQWISYSYGLKEHLWRPPSRPEWMGCCCVIDIIAVYFFFPDLWKRSSSVGL